MIHVCNDLAKSTQSGLQDYWKIPLRGNDMQSYVYVAYNTVGNEVKVKLAEKDQASNLVRIENSRSVLSSCACNNAQRRRLAQEAQTILDSLTVAQPPFDGSMKTVQLKWSYS